MQIGLVVPSLGTVLLAFVFLWSSKKQHTVAKSSAKAEYRSLVSLAADLTWISYLLWDIGISLPQPSMLFTDNISALHVLANPVLHTRMKHVELDYHFIREKVIWGAMVTKFVPLHQHITNIFLPNHCPNISVSNFEPSWLLLLIPPPAWEGM